MIKSQKDFFSGLMFTLVGGGFAWGATNYTIGTGARMGPGYFPMLLGIFLAVLGAFITFYSLVEHTEDGEPIGKFAWKPIVFVLGANVVFGILLAGLPSLNLQPMGLVVAIFLLVAVASMAGEVGSKIIVWMGCAVGFLMSIAILKYIAPVLVLLLEPGPILLIKLANMHEYLPKLAYYSAQFIGRLFSAAVPAYAFYKYVPVGKELKEYALLTLVLVCLSIWSFVSLLSLQMPVWPTFITG